MKEIREYIPAAKKYICDNCMNCTCTRSCVIWADAMHEQDEETRKLYHLSHAVHSEILGYFRYYADKYPVESCIWADGSKREVITIPVMDGSIYLDRHFIDILTAHSWNYRYDALLGKIYLLYVTEG